MKRVITLGIIGIVLNAFSISFAKEIPFTQDDRDRLIRLETKLDESIKRLEEGQKALQRQIDDLRTFMLWGFGILFGGMGILIGFVIWDRRTALTPAIRKNMELEGRQEKMERALKEMSTRDSNVAEALRHVGLL